MKIKNLSRRRSMLEIYGSLVNTDYYVAIQQVLMMSQG